ncbi:MAG: histidine--tRNA ligase [Candidatus Diapherotrites archaeon]|nr:histidine--tRNA ligase [Candidatus Diapherotrites archaeon]
MSEKILPPRGTRDYAPEEMILKNRMFDIIRKVYESFGFVPLETPAFESWELLGAKGSGGEEIKNEIYYFKDKSGRELGLRFDLTAPLSRFVANNPNLVKPFKRYQIGRAWRYDRPQAGRFREFYQADVDIVGSSEPEAEAEVLAAGITALQELKIGEFYIKVNDRRILDALAVKQGLPEERIIEIFRSVDKLEKIGEEGVMQELKEKGFDLKKAKKFLNETNISGTNDKILAKLKKELPKNDAVTKLEKLIFLLEKYKVADKVKLDIKIARGLDYYTGPVFETIAVGNEDLGSIASGGRFDKLIGLYGGTDTPATGFSLGADRIFEIYKRQGKVPKRANSTELIIVNVTEETLDYAIEVSQKLRRQGINAETNLLKRNMKKQLDYANSKGIKYVAIVGENEKAKGTVTLKNMEKNEQKEVKVDDLTSILT